MPEVISFVSSAMSKVEDQFPKDSKQMTNELFLSLRWHMLNS